MRSNTEPFGTKSLSFESELLGVICDLPSFPNRSGQRAAMQSVGRGQPVLERILWGFRL